MPRAKRSRTKTSVVGEVGNPRLLLPQRAPADITQTEIITNHHVNTKEKTSSGVDEGTKLPLIAAHGTVLDRGSLSHGLCAHPPHQQPTHRHSGTAQTRVYTAHVQLKDVPLGNRCTQKKPHDRPETVHHNQSHGFGVKMFNKSFKHCANAEAPGSRIRVHMR